MRKWLGSAAVVALVVAFGGTGASAADLSAAPVYRGAPPPLVAVFDWTGFYIGANIGYGSARVDGTTDGLSGDEHLNGVLGGGQIGYNWQTGNWVFGLEVDGQATGQKSSVSVSGGGITVTEDDSVPWFVTARGRGWLYSRADVADLRDRRRRLDGFQINHQRQRPRFGDVGGLARRMVCRSRHRRRDQSQLVVEGRVSPSRYRELQHHCLRHRAGDRKSVV